MISIIYIMRHFERLFPSALQQAVKLQKRASALGFDWTEIGPVLDKIEEEIEELRAELSHPSPKTQRVSQELGDVLFSVVNLARHSNLDPEAALRSANAKFEKRFRFIEQTLASLKICPEHAKLEHMEALWNAAKQKEQSS